MGEAGVGRARQGRSLQTERRLMAAVIALLDEGGLEACTAPAVAARAGMAVGSIYRRYADKDALVAAALLDMVSLGEGERDQAYAAIATEAADLAAFLRAVALAALTAVREHRALLLAIREFVRRSPDTDWRRRFQAQQGRGREVLATAAVARFGPAARGGESALRLALAAIYGLVDAAWLEPAAGLFATPPTEDEFVAAVVEMQMRYLT
jgi:AcrR family transcriptional regulator